MSKSLPQSPVNFSITQNIPVANHVYKYLKRRCGTDHITATRNTTIGSLILSILTRNSDLKPRKTSYTKVFCVTIQEDSHQRTGMHITAKNAQLFNDHVDRMFKEELFFHVVINKGIDAEMYMNSIRRFLDVYGITEDDIKVDTIYRDFKRRKKKLDTQLNLTPCAG